MKTTFEDKQFYFYYLRRETHEPYGCVCLRQDVNGKWARGISLCAPLDTFKKGDARRIAKGRCLAALFDQKSTECMTTECDRDVVADGMGVFRDVDNTCKSQYDATLTELERDITKKCAEGEGLIFDRAVEIAKAHGTIVAEAK